MAQEQKAGVGDLLRATERQGELAREIRRSVERLGDLSLRLKEMREELEATARKVGG